MLPRIVTFNGYRSEHITIYLLSLNLIFVSANSLVCPINCQRLHISSIRLINPQYIYKRTMNMRLLLLLVLLATVWTASTPALWSGTTLFNSSTSYRHVDAFSIISSATTKAGSSILPFTTTYTATPRLFYSIFKITSAPGDIFSFDVVLASATATGVTATYTVGASTSISSLSISVLSYVNSPTTSFLSVNFALTLPACKCLC